MKLKGPMVTLAGLALAGFAGPAQAHHAMGGRVPTEFHEGLLSGLAHPVINIDHFAFIVAVGVFTAVSQASFSLPLFFIAGTVVGCLLTYLLGFAPLVGVFVPLSITLVGLALALGRQRLGKLDIALFILGGALHGSAYAETIIGSDGTSLHGYLAGFALIQGLISLACVWAVYTLWVGDRLYTNARIAGGVIVGIGITVLAQTALAALLPV